MMLSRWRRFAAKSGSRQLRFALSTSRPTGKNLTASCPQLFVDQDPDESSQETTHEPRSATRRKSCRLRQGCSCRSNEKEEAVISWSPAERISASFSASILLIRAVLKESRKRFNVAVIHVDFFVNNAGFSQSGEFLSHDPRQEQAEVEVNVQVLVALTHHFPERFRAKVQGGTSRGLRTSDLAMRISPEVHP
jgi:hypothetical protein